jgi:DNA-binding IclR family transcriptional regulator
MPSERREGVQSLSRALDLLEALAEVDEITLSSLAERTGMLTSTAHRLLASLARRGYVTQNPANGHYLIGFKVVSLSGSVAARRDRLIALARPHLEQIRAATGESANLVALNGTQVVYLAQVEGSRAVRMFTEVGATLPAHATAAGKAILAFRPEAEVQRRYAKAGAALERLTPRTIATVEVLLPELERVRRRGYAIDEEEREEGVSCVAAPILGPDGAASAAISVSGPSARIITATTQDLADDLRVHADAVSALLGEHAPA